MSNDRELLGRAAKAAGIVRDKTDDTWYQTGGGWCRADWNPLTDDGDALRLAVKLRIDLLMDGHEIAGPSIEAISSTDAEVRPFAIESLDTGDPYAATRRAIVRAAAAMGEKA